MKFKIAIQNVKSSNFNGSSSITKVFCFQNINHGWSEGCSALYLYERNVHVFIEETYLYGRNVHVFIEETRQYT